MGKYLKENGIDYFKKVKAPFVPEKQLPKIIKGARKLTTKSLVEKTLVIDDEKYFTLSNSEISGNDGYYTDNKQTTPYDVKFKNKIKYDNDDNHIFWPDLAKAHYAEVNTLVLGISKHQVRANGQ